MKAQRALEVATNVAYLLVVASLLYMLFPGLRQATSRLVQSQLWLYQYGAYLERQRKLPAWKREALEVRGRRPRQPKMPGAA